MRFLGPTILTICMAGFFLAGTSLMAFELKTSAFTAGGAMPSIYTCQGKDISPPLTWSGAPEKTRSFVLICDDLDAPMTTWVHWVYYDIPSTASSLPEGMSTQEKPEQGGIHGTSSFGYFGYGGPCPPWGTHRYFFRLYALDTMLSLAPGEKKKAVLKAMEGHVLGTAELMGTYKKK